MSNFIEYIRRHVPPDWKISSSGWLHGNCPMCIMNGEPRPDKKGRGGFNFDNGGMSYHCFNCGEAVRWDQGSNITTKLKRLLIQFGADQAEIQRFKLQFKMQEDILSVPKKDVTKWKDTVDGWKTITLPEKTRKLFDVSEIKKNSFEYQAIEYIAGRGLEITDDWYISDYYMYKQRIILPLKYNSKIVGHTARLIKPLKDYPKYLKNAPKDYVFNLDSQKKDKKYVIVTEGYFDAVFTDGVGIGSNFISDRQAEIIESLNKDIIVVPDSNSPGRRLAMSAIERGWSVSYPPWDTGITDVNDAVTKYGRLFTIYSILNFAITNSTKAKVMAKTWCS